MFEIFVMFAVLVIFSVFLVIWFSQTLLELAINLPLLWIAGIRSYVEINREKKTKPYLIALAATTIIFLLVFGLLQLPFSLPIWLPTLFLIVMYLVAQLILLTARR